MGFSCFFVKWFYWNWTWKTKVSICRKKVFLSVNSPNWIFLEMEKDTFLFYIWGQTFLNWNNQGWLNKVIFLLQALGKFFREMSSGKVVE